jgi:hypothetical protein
MIELRVITPKEQNVSCQKLAKLEIAPEEQHVNSKGYKKRPRAPEERN